MRDYLSLGPTPLDEGCAQIGQPNYEQDAKEECKRYKDLLITMFGKPPGNAYLKTKGFSHDFGTYYEVCVFYDDESEEEINYAYRLESDSPETWKG